MSEDDNIKTLVAGYRERPDAHRALSQISARAATLALRQLEVTNFNNVEEKNKLISRAHQILRKICSNPLFSPSPLFNLASSTSPNDSSSSAAAAAAAAAATATNIESSVRSLDDDDDDDLGGGWDNEEESGGGGSGGGGGGGGRGEGGRDNDKERESNGYQRQQRQHDHTFQLSTPKSIEALRSSLAGANSVVEYKAVRFF